MKRRGTKLSDEEHAVGDNFMGQGVYTTPIDDEDIFEKIQSPPGGSSQGKRPRRSAASVDPPPEKKQIEHFCIVSDPHAKATVSSSSENEVVESTVKEEKWSIQQCIEVAQRLEGLEDELLFRVCDKAIASLKWREVFLSLPDEKKIGYIKRL